MFNGAFDLYGLFVEGVFGGVGLAILGVAVLIFLIALFSRMSTTSLIAILILYFLVCSIYYSTLSGALITILVFIYFFSAMIKLFSGGQG
jgi:hypothetical protein